MRRLTEILSAIGLLTLVLAPVSVAEAAPVTRTKTTTAVQPPYYAWMSTDVIAAWTAGYRGAGTTITVVDEYTGRDPFSGRFTNATQTQLHGYWTSEEAGLIAPSASIVRQNYLSGTAVRLSTTGLNVINTSYAMYARAGYSVNQIGWSAQESSIIADARNGKAIVVKAAGNDAVAVGTPVTSGTYRGYQDYLDSALIGAQSAIFVGALNSNGTTTNKASLASYSDKAGTNTAVQSHFLVVGVAGNQTGLYGTSFAAPIISGYAAVLGSKFKSATATQITNQLLNTARTNTLLNYNAATYGRGEASLANALAPISIR
ncbi:MAG: S8 family serine peptidase [Devosia sp.]|nr:S8 family serine peptidase [Devosia sp.]